MISLTDRQEYIMRNYDSKAFLIALKVDGSWHYYNQDNHEVFPGTESANLSRMSIPVIREVVRELHSDDIFIAYQCDDSKMALYPLNQLPEQGQTLSNIEFKPFCPFSDNDTPKEKFPTDAFPENCRDYIKAASVSYQVDEAMSACCVLAVLSSIFQRGGYRVRVNPDWQEPVNLYLICTAEPSERKSPVLRDATKPLWEAIDKWNEKNKEQIEWQKRKIEMLRKRLDSTTVAVSKRNKKYTEGDLKEAQDELGKAEEEQQNRQEWMVDDVTPEALSLVLQNSNESASLLSGEGGSILGILAGRYSQPGSGANLDLFLKAYSNEPAIIHRINRPSVSLKNPALSVLIMAQPSLLQDFISNDSFSGRGLCARFLYALPVSMVGNRSFKSTPIPDHTRQAYERLVSELADYILDWTPTDTTLTVTDEALSVLESLHNEIEPHRKDMSDAMQAWSGKIEGGIVRISALLYLTRHNGQPGAIDAETMRSAVEIGRYFQTEAEYAFQNFRDSEGEKDAKYLLKILQSDSCAEYRAKHQITRRELFNKVSRARFKSVSAMRKGIEELSNCGYIAEERVTKQGPGAPSYVIYLNPEGFE